MLPRFRALGPDTFLLRIDGEQRWGAETAVKANTPYPFLASEANGLPSTWAIAYIVILSNSLRPLLSTLPSGGCGM